MDTVLVGGSVVSIYTDGAYRSGDLDFVKLDMFSSGLEEAMEAIGFNKHGRHYIHPECKHLFVEFPGGPPLGIGEDNEVIPVEEEVGGVVIKIYSPTDCVKDRLASYIHFKAQECLDQAAMVASKHPVNFEKIEKWCKGEGAPSAYCDLLQKLK